MSFKSVGQLNLNKAHLSQATTSQEPHSPTESFAEVEEDTVDDHHITDLELESITSSSHCSTPNPSYQTNQNPLQSKDLVPVLSVLLPPQHYVTYTQFFLYNLFFPFVAGFFGGIGEIFAGELTKYWGWKSTNLQFL
ncbi:hypothetical protein CONCODRAFT_80250, partial [Conidiobolus coronatus NRRL 28638]